MDFRNNEYVSPWKIKIYTILLRVLYIFISNISIKTSTNIVCTFQTPFPYALQNYFHAKNNIFARFSKFTGIIIKLIFSYTYLKSKLRFLWWLLNLVFVLRDAFGLPCTDGTLSRQVVSFWRFRWACWGATEPAVVGATPLILHNNSCYIFVPSFLPFNHIMFKLQWRIAMKMFIQIISIVLFFYIQFFLNILLRIRCRIFIQSYKKNQTLQNFIDNLCHCWLKFRGQFRVCCHGNGITIWT